MLWRAILRPAMFCLPAERAHYTAMGAFSILGKLGPFKSAFAQWYDVDDPALGCSRFGIHFDNPVGLAAGFDKGARWYNELGLLGFSHIEVGTITGQAQSGNPKPRLFRLSGDKALINRMGFNNEGSEDAAKRLALTFPQKSHHLILGINIGKTKIVPLEQAKDDYLLSLERLFPYSNYFTVNVSSPNTPGLRELQDRGPLLDLLNALNQKNHELANRDGHLPRPVLLKIAPDLNDSQLQDIADIAKQAHLAGIIATNTTISRKGLKTSGQKIESIGAGGLSGEPLKEQARDVVRTLYKLTEGKIPIVGVGGISNGDDAWRMILAGASLIQLYTGFVYGGPGTVKSINSFLSEKLRKNQLQHIDQAVGGEGKFD